jgi:excinuclease ABC subunit C
MSFMEEGLRERPFSRFGDNPLHPYVASENHRLGGARSETLRESVRSRVPKVPGVYGMLDRNRRLIYVGKSKRIKHRLLSYFNPSFADEKAGRILESTRWIVWEPLASEFAALVREQQLIRHWQPRWNVQGIPKRQRPLFLSLSHPPASTFTLSRLPPRDASGCEGPFFGAERMRRSVELLNKCYLLRDCSEKQKLEFSNQLPLFEDERRPGCLRYELGTCLGPCVGACSRTAYMAKVQEARQFIETASPRPLEWATSLMHRAAAAQQYELAAKLRDDLEALKYLQRKLSAMASARRRYSFIYSDVHEPAVATAAAVKATWYLVHGGELIAAIAAPQCSDSYRVARPILQQWQQWLDTGNVPLPPIAATRALVAQWFKQHRDALQRTFAPRDASRRYRQPSMVSVSVDGSDR